MALSATVVNSHSEGDLKSVHGTFTTATGDTSLEFANSLHGMNYIADYKITLDTGGVTTPNPKVTISSGTLTALFLDTKGFSGKFYVKGR